MSMSFQTRIAQAALWAFVVALGILLGGAVYETLVITPLWAGATPESVWNWNANPSYQIRPEYFWRILSPLNALLALAALAAGWRATPARRRRLLTAAVCFELVVVSTVFFFVPIIIELLVNKGAGLSPAEITSKAEQWVNFNWLRLVMVITAWLSALSALSVPVEAKGFERRATASAADDLASVELRRAES